MIPSGADLLVRCLEREGVEYVFGVPGEETLDANDALVVKGPSHRRLKRGVERKRGRSPWRT